MNFPVHSEGTPHKSEAEITKERQDALGAKGFEVVSLLSHNISRLQAGGAVIERPDPVSEKKNQARFVPARTDIEGGWHEVRGAEGRTRLMRVTLLNPRDPQNNPEGHAEVELGDMGMRNGKVIAEKPSYVRLEVDAASKMHVFGTDKGFRFNVDHPNERSRYADLSAAERLLADAQAGVADLVSRMPEAAPPQAPQQ